MTYILILFVTGVLLLTAEVILPGGVMGGLGALLMLAGCVVAFVEFGVTTGLMATGFAVLLTGTALFIEFRILPKTKLGKRAFLQNAITGVSNPASDQLAALVGKSAQALTPLTPSGYVLVEGVRHEACCRQGHAVAGARLAVVGSDHLKLIVTPETQHA